MVEAVWLPESSEDGHEQGQRFGRIPTCFLASLAEQSRSAVVLPGAPLLFSIAIGCLSKARASRKEVAQSRETAPLPAATTTDRDQAPTQKDVTANTRALREWPHLLNGCLDPRYDAFDGHDMPAALADRGEPHRRMRAERPHC